MRSGDAARLQGSYRSIDTKDPAHSKSADPPLSARIECLVIENYRLGLAPVNLGSVLQHKPRCSVGLSDLICRPEVNREGCLQCFAILLRAPRQPGLRLQVSRAL